MSHLALVTVVVDEYDPAIRFFVDVLGFTLVDDSPDQEAIVINADELGRRRRLMRQAMKKLNPRERRILSERRLKDDPVTLEVLSQEYGVSRERVRQIEVRAFEKLQKAMLNLARALGPQPATA